MSDTIYALASGAGRAGIAVVRVSGPAADAALAAMAGPVLPPARVATRVELRDPATSEVLDDALALRFPAPRSYTGEDVVELHLHGGPAVVSAVLEALGRCKGLRFAEPGEFTRRAFLNGKMDLTAAEGLADLIAAETEAQRRQALRQTRGALGRLYDAWRERLVRALAHLEAVIDFPDEDLPASLREEIDSQISGLYDEISQHLDDHRRGERLRSGVYVTIIGPPNAGKSSLLNLLAQREAAIVSATAGTTRDIVEVHMDLGGYPVILADTAGLRPTAEEVEAEGVRRARERAACADLKIAVFDGQEKDGEAALCDLIDEGTIVVLNKRDLGPPRWRWGGPAFSVHEVSVRSGQGVEELLARIGEAVRACAELGEAPAITRARHREALAECAAALARARRSALPELAAEDLRLAARALGRLTGRVDVEELLDVIFRDFCIGK